MLDYVSLQRKYKCLETLKDVSGSWYPTESEIDGDFGFSPSHPAKFINPENSP